MSGSSDTLRRFEEGLAAVMSGPTGPECPPLLAAALQHAVFPGGARIRPKLCLAVATANGLDQPALALGAACAVD